MFLKTALRLEYGWRKTEENQKEQAFHIISYTATQIHTHTYFFVTLHKEKMIEKEL